MGEGGGEFGPSASEIGLPLEALLEADAPAKDEAQVEPEEESGDPEVLKHSDRTREILENDGRRMFELTGKSVQESLELLGVEVEWDPNMSPEDIEAIRQESSLKAQASLRPDGKGELWEYLLEDQVPEEVEAINDDLRDVLPDVAAIVGSVADHSEILAGQGQDPDKKRSPYQPAEHEGESFTIRTSTIASSKPVQIQVAHNKESGGISGIKIGHPEGKIRARTYLPIVPIAAVTASQPQTS